MISATSFEYFHKNLEAIREEKAYNSLFGQLKALKSADRVPYTVKCKGRLPKEIDLNRFWPFMRDKIYNPQKYLSQVESCTIMHEQSFGNVNHLARKVKTPKGEIIENVWINENSKSMLFCLEHNGMPVVARNELKSRKMGGFDYVVHYIVFAAHDKQRLAIVQATQEVLMNLINSYNQV